MINNLKYLSYTVSLILLNSGCSSFYSEYKNNEKIDIPKSFSEQDETNISQDYPIDAEWWKNFNDPLLTKRIETALKYNFDLLNSATSIEMLLGQFQQVNANLYPHFSASTSLATKEVRDSDMPNLKNGSTATHSLSIGLDNYEIDLFGKIQATNDEAKATILSSKYAHETLKISIASQVANIYLNIVNINEQIKIANENVQISKEIETKNELKYRYGLINESVYLQSQAEVQNAVASKIQFEVQRANLEKNLNALTGEFPDQQNRDEVGAFNKIIFPKLPEALPSTILQHRPDIKDAEQNLIISHAKITVARASYYPSISLTGMLGIQSLNLVDFVTNPAKIWSFTPALNIPIFNAGATEGAVKVAEAEHKKAINNYKKIIFNAFLDANEAIVQYNKTQEIVKYQQKRVQVIEKAFSQARLKYNAGTISYSDLLLVQQQWLQAKQNYQTAQQNLLTNIISLYKSFGGGWSDNN